MRAIDLALNDLLQVVRDKKSAIFLLIMPIGFTLFFGFALGSVFSDPRLPAALLDRDNSALSAKLQDNLGKSDAVRLVVIKPEEEGNAEAQVRDGKLAALVIVPAGFSEKALAGDASPLEVVTAPGSTAGQTAASAIQASDKRLLSAVTAARLAAGTAASQRPFADAAAREAFVNQALAGANAAWEKPDVTMSEAIPPGSVKVQAGSSAGFLQASPGMLVQFSIFALVTCAMVLVMERKSRTLQRLLTTPIARVGIIGGHVLGMFVVVFAQELILVLLGQVLFGVNYLRAPVATLAVMIALALWVACLGLLIGAVSKTEEHVVMWSLIAMFLFAVLAGAWFPLEAAGKTFAQVGHLTPGAWAMDGFQNIVMRGLGLESVLLAVAVILAYAAIFFGLAVWQFRFDQ